MDELNLDELRGVLDGFENALAPEGGVGAGIVKRTLGELKDALMGFLNGSGLDPAEAIRRRTQIKAVVKPVYGAAPPPL